MGYYEKEQEIIDALKKEDFASFKGDKSRAMAFLRRNLSSFPDYMNAVITQQALMPTWKLQLEPEEFRFKSMEMDRARRDAHEGAIGSVNALNRLCTAKLHIGPFSTVDTNDRYAVAEMVREYCDEVYDKGRSPHQGHEHRRSYDVSTHMAEVGEELEL